MAGPLLHSGATVVCSHGGRGEPVAPSPRVRVAGKPVIVDGAPYVVVGCPNGPAPCTTATFVSGATRVRASGLAVVLADSPSVSVPLGTPLQVLETQTRVLGR